MYVVKSCPIRLILETIFQELTRIPYGSWDVYEAEVSEGSALAGFIQKIRNKKIRMCQFWIHYLITKRFRRKNCISLTVVFFAKLEICFFIATSCNLDSVVICYFCVRTLMLLWVMNAKLTHPYLPYLFYSNFDRENEIRTWLCAKSEMTYGKILRIDEKVFFSILCNKISLSRK